MKDRIKIKQTNKKRKELEDVWWNAMSTVMSGDSIHYNTQHNKTKIKQSTHTILEFENIVSAVAML